MASRRSRPRFRVQRLPLGLFGFHREDVLELAARMEAERQGAADGFAALADDQRARIARTLARRDTLEQMLVRLRSDRERLERQLAKARENAPALEGGAQSEIARLQAEHEAELARLEASVPEVEQAIAGAESRVRELAEALARVLSGMDPEVAGSDYASTELASVLAALLAQPPQEMPVLRLPGGRARFELPPGGVKLQMRGGAAQGSVLGVVASGPPRRVLGFVVATDGGEGVVPVADVAALRQGAVLVRDKYRLLDAASLTEESTRVIFSVGRPSRVQGQEQAAPGAGSPGQQPALQEPQAGAETTQAPAAEPREVAAAGPAPLRALAGAETPRAAQEWEPAAEESSPAAPADTQAPTHEASVAARAATGTQGEVVAADAEMPLDEAFAMDVLAEAWAEAAAAAAEAQEAPATRDLASMGAAAESSDVPAIDAAPARPEVGAMAEETSLNDALAEAARNEAPDTEQRDAVAEASAAADVGQETPTSRDVASMGAAAESRDVPAADAAPRPEPGATPVAAPVGDAWAETARDEASGGERREAEPGVGESAARMVAEQPRDPGEGPWEQPVAASGEMEMPVADAASEQAAGAVPSAAQEAGETSAAPAPASAPAPQTAPAAGAPAAEGGADHVRPLPALASSPAEDPMTSGRPARSAADLRGSPPWPASVPLPAWQLPADPQESAAAEETVAEIAAEPARPATRPVREPVPRPATTPAQAPPAAMPAATGTAGLNILAFISGKVVGRDLVAPDGRLLAARGTYITPELVAIVEAAGMLPEMIVYMTLPEAGR